MGQASRLPNTRHAPQHACPTIVIRRAAEGEKFTTLDGQERTLTSQMLLIADETKAVALAGVMGGQNSEINLNTADVLIESACFKPQNIRATSKKLELRTESSYRFERGADIGICDWASQRAAQLILETAGGTLAQGVVDAYPKAFEPKQIALRHTQTDAVLGIAVPMEQQIECLQRLGLEIVTAAGIAPSTGVRMPHTTVFRVPSFRVDLKREIDLIEEVARLYGVDKIPATAPRGAIGSNPYDAVHDQLADARRILTGLGLFEAQGQTLISDAAAKLMAGDALVPLSNPLSSDMNVLRPSLLPGLLDALRHNLSHKTYDVALFEVGRVFNVAQASPPASSPGVPPGMRHREERRVAIALTGQRNPLFWSGNDREAKFDIYDLKGLLEEFLEQFGLRGMNLRPPAGQHRPLAGIGHRSPWQIPAWRVRPIAAAAGPAIRFARRRAAGRAESRSAAGAPEHHEIIPAAAGLPGDPPRRGDDRARGDHARSRPPGGQAGQAGEPGNRRTLRRVSRQERSRRARRAWLTPSPTATRSGR